MTDVHFPQYRYIEVAVRPPRTASILRSWLGASRPAPEGQGATSTLEDYDLEGPINGQGFLLYVQKVLVPTLMPGDMTTLAGGPRLRRRNRKTGECERRELFGDLAHTEPSARLVPFVCPIQHPEQTVRYHRHVQIRSKLAGLYALT